MYFLKKRKHFSSFFSIFLKQIPSQKWLISKFKKSMGTRSEPVNNKVVETCSRRF